MAKGKKPAKIASMKKGRTDQKICPITGKPMTPVKVYRSGGPNGMFWVVVEDFDGSDQSVDRMIPVR